MAVREAAPGIVVASVYDVLWAGVLCGGVGFRCAAFCAGWPVRGALAHGAPRGQYPGALRAARSTVRVR